MDNGLDLSVVQPPRLPAAHSSVAGRFGEPDRDREGALRRKDETRTLDQLRADVFGDILVDGVTDALPPKARGIRATEVVTVPALALLDGDGTGFATVEAVGPIQRARELGGGAEGWMRVLTDPETGIVLSVARKQYRPPPELRRLVRRRAGRCTPPGCGIPAARCEIDHTIDWEHGG